MERIETVSVENLTKTFTLSRKQMKLDKVSSNKKVAVKNVSFKAYAGEIFGILGPNGAGKTTTLRCISTLIKPDSGNIKVAGYDIKDEFNVKRSIGFLTNELKLESQMTPRYAFDYFARFYDIDQAEIDKRRSFLFEKFGIERFSEVKYGDLSTGMKQKTSIAVSLAHNPDIIVFDEPTNGLDIITARQVTDYLRELKDEGKTVIVSTHIMSLVEKLCDRALIIIDGESVVEDTIENIMSIDKTKDLEEIFFKIFTERQGLKYE